MAERPRREQKRVRCMICVAVTARSPKPSLSAAEAIRYLQMLLQAGDIAEIMRRARIEVHCRQLPPKRGPPVLEEEEQA